MTWTAEDTEVLQISNRVLQVFCKREPVAYGHFMGPSDQPQHELTCTVGDFELRIFKGRTAELLVSVWWVTKQMTVFRYRSTGGKNRPDYRWNETIVREQVIPALDREMILEDLSLL